MKISHPPIVQISLDLTDIKEAIETARIAVESGVDWLEAGTPLILAKGLHGVRALRREFPDHPIVADLKTMDGGYLEAEMMAKAGATHVVVMARAHAETIKCVVKAGRDFGVKVMGDNMVFPDKAAASKWMEDLGVDYIVHHTGFDERNGIFADTGKRLSPLDDLKAVVEDGKLLFAHAISKGEPLRPVEEYFLKAVETVRSNRRNYKKRRPAPFGESTRIGFDSVATQSGAARTPDSGAKFRV